MKIRHIFILFILVAVFTTTTSATDVNGRFIVNGTANGKLEVLLQINTNTGTAGLGGANIVIGFNNYALNFSSSPQVNTHYIFHNFSSANYTTATVTKPMIDKIWLNIDLPFTSSNNGYIVSGTNGWTNVATLFFDIVNPSDTLKLTWLTSNTYWGMYNSCNTVRWNPGTFSNLIHVINTDLTPPQILSASPLDSAKLEITFSEPLEISSATNIANYTISNGISIISAYLSSNQNKITLNTTPHTPGQNYIVTARNVRDLAGNLISINHNTAVYVFNADITSPVINGITVTSNQSITVKFSERLDPVTAKDKYNYSISNNVGIISATLLPDSTEVKLKTSKHSANLDYVLKVSGIKDRAGNVQAPNPKFITYRLPGKIKGNSTENRIASAISNTWTQDYTPEKTIDGLGMSNQGSRWQSAKVMPDTITYDLEESLSIDSLRISFYKGESGRLYKYSVYTSTDLNEWSTIVEDIWSDEAEWTEIEFDSTSGRYLKLILQESNQGNKASIWEFESYGVIYKVNGTEDPLPPVTSELLQNYPNPFNPSTKISWQSPESGHQTLKVYDVLGNEVATLVDEYRTAGNYEVRFEAGNLASGIYVYRLTAGNFIQTKKMVLLR